MNIFVLDHDIKKCAEYHCNKHVVKMILEYCQMLCCAHHVLGGGTEIPYQKTHPNHPCSVWVRSSRQNYDWLLCLLENLLEQYWIRYGKEKGKHHKSVSVFKWLKTNIPNLPDNGLTDFALAMPDQYKSSDVVWSYRNYYINDKKDFLDYKNVDIPPWMIITA